MDKKEAGRFRGQVFGGFHRRDVLNYMATLYGRIDQADLEKEALRVRCEELENLLQNLEKFSGQGAGILAGVELSPPPEMEGQLEMDPELIELLHDDVAREPEEEAHTQAETPEAGPEAGPEAQEEETPEAEVSAPVPATPEPVSEFAPVPEPAVSLPVPEPTSEPEPVVSVPVPAEEPKPDPEPVPPAAPPTPAAKPGLAVPYPPPDRPKRVKVYRK